MMGDLTGKVCLVTGAARGIGRAVAERLAADGATVYATGRSTESLQKWVDECPDRDRLIVRQFDVTDSAAAKALIMEIKKEQGGLDVLVNNAAIERNERIGMISRAGLAEMFETNVFGLIDLLQLAARIMQRVGKGSIINITSRVGERGGAGQLAYAASKGAVIAATKSAAKELATSGIRVNAVSPGLTDTDMYRDVPEEKMAERLRNICMGRLAKPEEIANAVAFLASDRSEFISGQIINVDGCTII